MEGSVTARKPYFGLIVSGLISGAFYLALYLFRNEIMDTFTRTDGWYPALPVLTAFLFSLVHGAFAGYCWDVLGVTGIRRG
jgi:ABC-type multidrug transport system fused ATPase/permease subunit